jgi:alpha-amylase/alpha-mannosidase (GH57 family)
VTFNLVPSLLVQLEAFAADRAHDRFLELSLKPADTLTEDDVFFMVANFFHAQRQRMIDVYPRYADLLAQRGHPRHAADLRAAARRFSTDDLLDLQVWHKLAWIDPSYLASDPRVRRLIAKGQQFTEEDKAELRRIELELLNATIPAYRERAARGQIEISTSPFYHPILPLLCDTDVYKRTHPQSRMPRHRFLRPEDALEQLTRAGDCHERLFGKRPVGLWPSEGSVSDEMVPLVAQAGFEWMATDEQILGLSLGIAFTRDGRGRVDQPDRLYAPYIVRAGGAQVACGFRDHALSDRIGFVYAGWEANAAADDFTNRLVEAGAAAKAQNGGGEPTIFVILDGENAWEHFEGGGRPFLRGLYRRLSSHPELRTVTMAEACRSAQRLMTGIFPGSWIDANFYIWIGHQDDQRGWSQLAEAREALDAAGPAVDAAAFARAKEEVLIAEGSDWFWWYGDDHSSEHDLEFDDLFRRHLRNVYRLLQKPVPDELFVSNITVGVAAAAQADPTGLISPTIDGEETSYFEWLGAGLLEVREVAGAMHQADRRPASLTSVRFGFDRAALYVRLDGARTGQELLDEGLSMVVTFIQPVGLRVVIDRSPGQLAASLWSRTDGPPWARRDTAPLKAAAGTIIEVAIDLAALGLAEAAAVSFFITLHDANGAEIERHPMHRPIEARVPDASFASRNWTA